MAQVHCKLAENLPDYVIEPLEGIKFMAPRVLREGSTDPIICLLNPTDRYKLIKKGQQIATAYPVYQIYRDTSELPDTMVPTVSHFTVDTESDVKKGRIPSHLEELYTLSCQNLDKVQQKQLASLLVVSRRFCEIRS